MTDTIWEIGTIEELSAIAGELLSIVKKQNNQGGAMVLALSGDLGAGKTTFVQCLAKHLGVVESVTSPTFVVMKAYDLEDAVFTQLVHVDAYRIVDVSEMHTLRFGEVLANPAFLVCIEWPERIATILPDTVIRISLELKSHSRHKITYHGR